MILTMRETRKPEANDCCVIRIDTPDGTMFVTVIENEQGDPFNLHVFIGKTGTQIRAWTDAVQALASLALEKGAHITDIITALSLVTSHKTTMHRGIIPIRSGPEGVAFALKTYLSGKANVVIGSRLPILNNDKLG